jgi:hypothetical protein
MSIKIREVPATLEELTPEQRARIISAMEQLESGDYSFSEGYKLLIDAAAESLAITRALSVPWSLTDG